MSSHGKRRGSYKPPLEVQVRLGQWGLKGAALAEVEGRSVGVDRGIPGELATISVARHRKPWHGVVQTVEEPSPDRVTAPCPAYAAGCGGCQWQHLSYDAQIEAKRRLVEDHLLSAGVSLCVSAVHRMEHPWRYRHTAAIALGWEAGFRPRGRRGIVEIHDCPISHPLIGLLADHLNELLRAECLPGYHGKVWLDCTVLTRPTGPGLQVVIQGIEGLTLEAHPELPEVAARLGSLDEVVSVAYRHHSGAVFPLLGELEGTVEVAGGEMWQPAGAFSQTNVHMLNRLIDCMRAPLVARTPRHVADVYGGSGTFALAFAPLVQRMTLIELDGSAVLAARRTAQQRDYRNIDFVQGHAEEALATLTDVDCVIVDPPRSGLGPIVTDAIARSSATALLYVSCSPYSLARDLASLSTSGFVARSLDIFDFYPQTYHVESFVVLDRPR